MVIYFTLEALWPPGESEEDDGEAEEPKICAPKQFGFDWAHTWLEEGGALIVDEDKAQVLLSQVFLVFSGFIPFPSSSDDLFPYTGLCLCFKINWCFHFFSGFMIIAVGYHPEAGGRPFEGQGQLTGGLQQIECAVTGSKAEGLYDLHHRAVAQPETSLSVGLLLPKRKKVATATIASLTA